MADIYDLAQSINRRRKQASQGYASGWEDLPMQVMKVMDTREKENRVSLKQDAQILQKLIQSADTEEEINALTEKASSYLKETTDADMPFYGDFINNQVNEQRDSYYEAKNAMEWFGNKLDERTPEFDSVYSGIKRQEGSDRAQRHNNPGAHIWIPELEEKFGAKKGDAFTGDDGQTYYTAFYDDANKGDEASRFIAKRIWDKSGGDIDKFVSDYSKNKNPEELKGYADTIKQNLKNNNYLNYSVDDMMGFSLDEIERRREEFERLAPGLQGMEKYGFKFNKGNYADATLKREMIEYGQRLDATLKAHLTGGILTEEEAGSIMRGTYKEDKESVLKKINDNMDSYQSNIAKIDKLILGQLDEDATSQILQQYNLEGMSGSQLQSELSDRRGQYQNALNLERKRQYAWEGLSQTAIEDDFRSNIDDDDNDGSLDDDGGEKVENEVLANAGSTVSQSWLNNVYDMAYSKIGLSKKETEILLANYNATHNNEITKGSTPSDQTLLNYFRKNQSSLDPPKQIEPVKGYDTQSEIKEYWNENVSIPEAKQSGLPSIGVQNQGGGKFKFLIVKDGKWEIYKGKTASMNGVKVPIKTVNGKKYYYDYKKGAWK